MQFQDAAICLNRLVSSLEKISVSLHSLSKLGLVFIFLFEVFPGSVSFDQFLINIIGNSHDNFFIEDLEVGQQA
jgi:hypothetical protein